MEKKNKLNYVERSEEVSSIIERMPENFNVYIILITCIITLILLTLGWFIRYPDIVSGDLRINSTSSTINLVANSSGTLHLGSYKDQSHVKKGDYLAYINTSASTNDVRFLSSQLENKDDDLRKLSEEYSSLPKNLSLGELDGKYFAFLDVAQKLNAYYDKKKFAQRIESIAQIIAQRKKYLKIENEKVALMRSKKSMAEKFRKRDSLLFARRVISEQEYDNSKINAISASDNLASIQREVFKVNEEILDAEDKMQQTIYDKSEQEIQLRLEFTGALNDLRDAIRIWEQKYVFKAPMTGKVQFLSFWSNNQSIASGQEVFAIVPESTELYAQLFLPSERSGKIKVGQEVILKLSGYPVSEYGNLSGRISSISLTSNPLQLENEKKAAFIARVKLPSGLRTNYGELLEFRPNSTGVGEVITNDRKLLERLFEKIIYAIKK